MEGCICCGCVDTQKYTGSLRKGGDHVVKLLAFCPPLILQICHLVTGKKVETLFAFLTLPITRLAECSCMMIHSSFMKLEIIRSCLLLCWTSSKQLNCGLQIGRVSFYFFQSNCVSSPTVLNRPQLY